MATQSVSSVPQRRLTFLLLAAAALLFSAGLFAGQNALDECGPITNYGDPEILASLNALECGEYEIVVTKSGSIYVGTCVMMLCKNGGRFEKTLVQTSGMEIEEDQDAVTGIEQASLAAIEIKRI